MSMCTRQSKHGGENAPPPPPPEKPLQTVCGRTIGWARPGGVWYNGWAPAIWYQVYEYYSFGGMGGFFGNFRLERFPRIFFVVVLRRVARCGFGAAKLSVIVMATRGALSKPLVFRREEDEDEDEDDGVYSEAPESNDGRAMLKPWRSEMISRTGRLV